jgi:histone H3/H4
MTPEMSSDATTKASDALTRYSVDEKRYNSRQEKAGISIPPATVEKFLRDFGCSKLMVTRNSPIYLACVIEHVARVLLDPAKDITLAEGRMRITIRELELSVSTSENLRILFKNCSLSFIGGGVVPEIHESLLNKKPRRRKKTEDVPKKTGRRFRPGTVSLREIKKMQRTSNCLVFAKLPFERFVRRLLEDEAQGVKVSKEVFIILQHYIEQYIVGFLRDANSAAIHSGRVKLVPCDIKFISTLRDGRQGDLFSGRLSSGSESNDI